jgi:hypothetical protein
MRKIDKSIYVKLAPIGESDQLDIIDVWTDLDVAFVIRKNSMNLLLGNIKEFLMQINKLHDYDKKNDHSSGDPKTFE